MSGGPGVEDAFAKRGGAGRGGDRPPGGREPALLRRSPAFAAVTAALAGWLLYAFLPDVAFYFSSREPIDLGGPGAYRLDSARQNRLVQIRGELVDELAATGRGGEPRTVGRIAGTNLLVDRPGRGGPPIFEGRLLPAGTRSDYAPAAAVMTSRGAPLGDAWQVLRDGDRPRSAHAPVAGAAVLLVVIAVNLRALAKHFLS